jgi:voltage-gated potassium channel
MLTLITLLFGKVTRSQIVTLLILGVISVVGGGIAFAIVDHRTVWTGLYWAITTATTVGYGDVVPTNGVGRIVAIVVMLTAIPLFGATFALFAAAATATRLSRFLHMDHHLPPGRYVVLLGMHPTIPLVSRELRDAGYLVVVAADVESSALPSHVHHIPGSPTDEETVRATKPADAEAVLLIAADDGEMLVSAVLLRHVAPEVPVVAVAQSSMVARALADLGIERTISTEALLGHTLAKSLEAPHAADVLLRLIDGEGYKLEEVPVATELIGSSLRAVRAEMDGLLLGMIRAGRVTLGIRENPTLAEGDRLVRVAAE